MKQGIPIGVGRMVLCLAGYLGLGALSGGGYECLGRNLEPPPPLGLLAGF